jgi:hypothetical protein
MNLPSLLTAGVLKVEFNMRYIKLGIQFDIYKTGLKPV